MISALIWKGIKTLGKPVSSLDDTGSRRLLCVNKDLVTAWMWVVAVSWCHLRTFKWRPRKRLWSVSSV